MGSELKPPAMSSLIEKAFLQYSSRLSGLRRVPGVGGLMHALSYRMLPPDRLAWIKVRSGLGQGLWLNLRPRTGLDYYEGKAEPALQEIFGEYLHPGMVVYDLGANVGFFTLLAARIVGSGGKIFSFEADPDVAQQVKANSDRNAFPYVHVVQRAVWSRTGSVQFSRADTSRSPDRGLGRVLASHETQEKTIAVSSIALDDFASTHPAPDFIKCDVEGAEYEVFMGARELISAHRPLVACEVHSDQNAVLLTRLFQELGYSLNWFTRSHFLGKPIRLV
jgi:FkbM family methyltransferase